MAFFFVTTNVREHGTTRADPYSVIYIDPALTMAENLTPSKGDLRFESFEAWYEFALERSGRNQ